MASLREERRMAYVEKARAELSGLAGRGVSMGGNAFSSVLFLKGELSASERDGGRLLAGEDGDALRASLAALGYAPEDWCALSVLDSRSGEPLSAPLLLEAVLALDPATLVACDEPAAACLREALAQELVALEDFRQAMLEPGLVVQLLGMRVMNLGGFAASLADARQKQLMWARLKQLPPLGEPF
ncbi:hypothetical protein [Olsenella urininfantis]|uniref:hypothetical protein n=1 Tax=Olsenella urininfantis TaxID=1871033 RepID=UPI000985C6B1|nr:hypothetical protein [Olsenella urininfantis]